jgi:hypothetical protein
MSDQEWAEVQDLLADMLTPVVKNPAVRLRAA